MPQQQRQQTFGMATLSYVLNLDAHPVSTKPELNWCNNPHHTVPLTPMSTLRSQPRSLAFAILDVFAERPLEGNALAVFTDGRGLSTDADAGPRSRNQPLRNDVHSSSRAGDRTGARFARSHLHHAGGVAIRRSPHAWHRRWVHLHHPTLRGSDNDHARTQRRHDLRQFHEPRSKPGVFGTMRQNDPVFGQVHDREAVAAALGLTPEDLDPACPFRPSRPVSPSASFRFDPCRSRTGLRSLSTSRVPYLARTDAKFFHCICPRRSGFRLRTGTRACSSTTAKTRLLAPPRVARSRIWLLTRSRTAVRKSSSNRAWRCCDPAESTLAPHGTECRFEMCLSAGAPFSLHKVRFSCPESCVLHRMKTETPNGFAQFEQTVNAQPGFPYHIRHFFAVAKAGNPSYCWEALRRNMCSANERFAPNRTFPRATSATFAAVLADSTRQHNRPFLLTTNV